MASDIWEVKDLWKWYDCIKAILLGRIVTNYLNIYEWLLTASSLRND